MAHIFLLAGLLARLRNTGRRCPGNEFCLPFRRMGVCGNEIAEVMAVYRVLESSASHFVDYRKRDAFCESSYNLRLFFAQRYAPDRCRELEEDKLYLRFGTALAYRKMKAAELFYDALLERGADMSRIDRRAAVARYRRRRIRARLMPWRWKE